MPGSFPDDSNGLFYRCPIFKIKINRKSAEKSKEFNEKIKGSSPRYPIIL